MAAGTAVIASRLPAHEALLPPACGRLVAPEDAVSLASALDALLGDPALTRRMGRRGRLTARGYSWNRVLRVLAEVYTTAAGRRLRAAWG
jgi:glycosyltransferase involved in cell wall biosynthesis